MQHSHIALVFDALATQLHSHHELETVLDVFDWMGRKGQAGHILHPDYVLEKTITLSRGFSDFWCVLDETRRARFCTLIRWQIDQRLGHKRPRPFEVVPFEDLMELTRYFQAKLESPETLETVRNRIRLLFRGVIAKGETT